MTTYKASFSVQGNWAECNGIRIETSGADTGRPLCRAMVDAELEDGALEMYDERGMLCYTYKSMHHSAKFMMAGHDLIPYDSLLETANVPSGISSSVFDALQRVRNGEWNDLHHLSKKSVRSYVNITEDSVTVNEDGEAAIAAYNIAPPKNAGKILLTDNQVIAFTIARENNRRKWEKLHGKTTNLMIGKGWVTLDNSRPVITAAGEAVLAMQG